MREVSIGRTRSISDFGYRLTNPPGDPGLVGRSAAPAARGSNRDHAREMPVAGLAAPKVRSAPDRSQAEAIRASPCGWMALRRPPNDARIGEHVELVAAGARELGNDRAVGPGLKPV
jgi:hypothetical protein